MTFPLRALAVARLPLTAVTRQFARHWRGLVLLTIAAGLTAVVVSGPFARYTESREHVSSLSASLEQVRAVNDGLEQRITHLSDPIYVEMEARRRLGLAHPGERSYVLERPAGATDTDLPGVPPRITRLDLGIR